MANDRSGPDIVILARHLAESGKFKNIQEIEVALIGNGKRALLSHLSDHFLRDELDRICAASRAKGNPPSGKLAGSPLG